VGKFQIFLIRFLSVTHRSSFAASEGLTEIRIYFSLQLAVPFVDENEKKITVLLLIGTEIAILHIPFLQAGRAASLPGRRRLWTNTGEGLDSCYFLRRSTGMLVGKMVGGRGWSVPEAWSCLKELYELL